MGRAARVGCLLVLALAGCGRPVARRIGVHADADEPVPVGSGRLLPQVQYPAVLNEAIARIRDAGPDAVTFNEACSGDVASIARRTGYHWRFSTVIYYGKPLMCIRPGGRGLFGDAVLTRAAVVSSDSRAFKTQAGPEQRRLLCVNTRARVDACTAHLAPPRPMRWLQTARSAPSSGRCSRGLPPPYGDLRGRPQPSLLLRPRWLLGPHRRVRPPGPRELARLRIRRASLALGAGGAGHAHRPRRPGGPRAPRALIRAGARPPARHRCLAWRLAAWPAAHDQVDATCGSAAPRLRSGAAR